MRKYIPQKRLLDWDTSNISWDYTFYWGNTLIEMTWDDWYNFWYKIINIYKDMLRYLHNSDYFVIQDVQLQQVIQKNQNKLEKAERTAIEEAESYITQRFDMSYEFTNTGSWSASATYSAHDRIILDYPDYSTAKTYSYKDCAIYNGDCYCLTGTTSFTGSFSTVYWTNIGYQYSIYYALYPEQLFYYLDDYKKDEQVYWKDRVWTCVVPTQQLSQSAANQYLQYQNIPLQNVFPDDTESNSGYKYWTPSATYSIPAGTLPNDKTYWIEGDNRSSQMIMYLTDMVLYHLHKSISPKNIPDLRVVDYRQAIDWLKAVGSGEITTKVLQLQPQKGMMFRYGGNTKNPNQW